MVNLYRYDSASGTEFACTEQSLCYPVGENPPEERLATPLN